MLDNNGKINSGLLTGNRMFFGNQDGCLEEDFQKLGFIGQYCLLTIEVINSSIGPQIGLMRER